MTDQGKQPKQTQANQAEIKEETKNTQGDEIKEAAQRVKQAVKGGDAQPGKHAQKHTPKGNDNVIEQLQKQVEDLNDKLLRSMAETENIRRRAEKDVQKAHEYSIENFAKDIASVLDNIHRASETITDEMIAANDTLKAVKEGIELTKKEMSAALDKQGVKRVFPLNEPFDHNFHQAMSQVEDKDKQPNTVIQVVKAGYTIKDRLLHPALVIVSK